MEAEVIEIFPDDYWGLLKTEHGVASFRFNVIPGYREGERASQLREFGRMGLTKKCQVRVKLDDDHKVVQVRPRKSAQ